MHEVGYYLGVHPLGALTTVIATVLLYFTFVGVLRWRGQRIWASPSSLDLAVVSMIGALVGRATMGRNPTLVGGAIALVTLLTCEGLARQVRRTTGGSRAGRAAAVVIAGQVDPRQLERFRVDEAALWSALREAGVSSPEDVGLAVLEPSGRFSVLRADAVMHESVLLGVRGSEDVRARLVAAGLITGPAQPLNETSG